MRCEPKRSTKCRPKLSVAFGTLVGHTGDRSMRPDRRQRPHLNAIAWSQVSHGLSAARNGSQRNQSACQSATLDAHIKLVKLSEKMKTTFLGRAKSVRQLPPTKTKRNQDICFRFFGSVFSRKFSKKKLFTFFAPFSSCATPGASSPIQTNTLVAWSLQ